MGAHFEALDEGALLVPLDPRLDTILFLFKCAGTQFYRRPFVSIEQLTNDRLLLPQGIKLFVRMSILSDICHVHFFKPDLRNKTMQ